MFSKSSLFAAAVLALGSVGAQASVVDLSPINNTQGPSVSVPELTISSDTTGALISVGEAALPFGTEIFFCSFGTGCDNDFTIDFTAPSNGVKINVGDVGPASATNGSDSVFISAFDAMDALLGSITIGTFDLWGTTSPPAGASPVFTTVDFSAFSGISKLTFDDSSDSVTGGFFYFGIEATPVPVPASIVLLAMGVGAFGVAARSRRRKAA